MKLKNVGKALLFGAAVGTATYAVQKLLPAIVDGLGFLKAAWEATKDDLETMCLYDDISGEPVTFSCAAKSKYGPTAAETVGRFLGIPTEKARKLLENTPTDEEDDNICEACEYLDPGDEHCKRCDACEMRSRCDASGFCDDRCYNLDALPKVAAEVESAKFPYNAMSGKASRRLVLDDATFDPFDLRAVLRN